jgi:molybdopterin molybdotransferase
MDGIIMPEYLKLLPPAEALRLFFEKLPPVQPLSEIIQTKSAHGRVTSEAILASEPLPAFSRSTVDGFAIKAMDSFGASDSLPTYLSVNGEVPMGGLPGLIIKNGQAAVIHTGGMIPEGADSVVMIEFTQRVNENEVEILRPIAFEENIIRIGEDVAKGQQVIPAGVKLRPAEIGGLLALGLLEVKVACKLRVGIISTGDEVVSPEKNIQPGQVRDINSFTLSALIEQVGGIPVLYGIIPDDFEKLKLVVNKAYLENDIVVITAGSSASVRDLTSDVVAELGNPGVIVHGINIKPGKPTLLAVCNGKPVVGLPGNPVSALVIAYLFVVPLIEWMSGLAGDRPKPITLAKLEVNIPSQTGREDWIPVRLKQSQNNYLATPIFFKSNLIFSLAGADGFVRVPASANGLDAGSSVEIYLF